jgi:hypothetical protein
VDRKLVTSEAQIVALVVAALSKTEGDHGIGAFLGIEFAFADGRYPRDLEAAMGEDDEDWSWEDQPVDYTTYRRREDAYFPATYPALALYSFSDDYDRGGSVKTRMLVYVEQHELVPDEPPK